MRQQIEVGSGRPGVPEALPSKFRLNSGAHDEISRA